MFKIYFNIQNYKYYINYFISLVILSLYLFIFTKFTIYIHTYLQIIKLHIYHNHLLKYIIKVDTNKYNIYVLLPALLP